MGKALVAPFLSLSLPRFCNYSEENQYIFVRLMYQCVRAPFRSMVLRTCEFKMFEQTTEKTKYRSNVNEFFSLLKGKFISALEYR